MTSLQNESSKDLELVHYGVKGMRWGVRREKDEINSQDRTLKSGTEIQNITSRQFRSSDRHIYAAYTSYDKSQYADMMGNFMYNGRNVHKNEFVVKKDIKIPSDKKLTESFVKFAKENPDVVAKDMAKAHNDLNLFSIKSAKSFEKKINTLDPSNIKAGDEFTKLYISQLASKKTSPSREMFFGGLINEGYSAISDLNDRDRAFGTQDPLIIINPTKALGPVKSVKLTKKDLERYEELTASRRHSKSRADLKEVQR